MNKNYELTLEKEILREGAWEVLARVHKIEKRMNERTFLINALENKISEKIRSIPNMSADEVKVFNYNIKFLNEILKMAQGVEYE